VDRDEGVGERFLQLKGMILKKKSHQSMTVNQRRSSFKKKNGDPREGHQLGEQVIQRKSKCQLQHHQSPFRVAAKASATLKRTRFISEVKETGDPA
jgi:hypothetical protein